MRKLTLKVRKISWHPFVEISALIVEDSQGKQASTPVGKGGDLDDRSKESIQGICFLIIHTFLLRKHNPTQEGLPPVFPVGAEYLPFLRTLFNSKVKVARGWQEDVFGGSPFYGSETFLATKGSGRTDTAEPYILPSVEVSVESEDVLNPLKDSQLAGLAENLAAGVVSNPAKLTIKIKGSDFEINSSNRLGELGLNDRAQVIIGYNFLCELYVRWITCKNTVIPLYPKNQASSGPPGLTKDNKGQRTLSIPEHEQMEIKASPGHEICLVAVSQNSLNQSQVDLLDEEIAKAVSNHDGSVLIGEPKFRKYSLSQREGRLLRRRFGEVASPTGWEVGLVEGLKTLVQTVYLFYIPNRE
ncbi:hypothetical protein N9062_00325 [Akkermansiaceae bacterium]|nr:hypothetical protein [Akkermansiaceae bacterium]MDA7907315.1 hypothetical protein [Akkermansiaceae bacterium]MDB4509422.1 hypothetical protein [Akkermansiaceae bacterium]